LCEASSTLVGLNKMGNSRVHAALLLIREVPYNRRHGGTSEGASLPGMSNFIALQGALQRGNGEPPRHFVARWPSAFRREPD
jgi:hypothetical protein